MTRRLPIAALLALLVLLATLSLAWGSYHALAKSDDLLRRWDEVRQFAARSDPYALESMTYPPTALPIFAPVVAPFGREGVKAFWLALNLAALGAVCVGAVQLCGEGWPPWLKVAFGLAVVASKPARGGIGLGQFHLIPTALLLWSALALRARRPVAAGLLAGLALAKPTMALPYLGILVARREGKALAAALGLQAMALVGASAWLGIGPRRLMAEWLRNARGQVAAGSIDVPSLVLQIQPGTQALATVLGLAVLAAGFAVTLAYRQRPIGALLAFNAFVAAIFTYHRPYDLVLLIPALAASWEVAAKSKTRVRIAAAVGFALLLIVPNDASVARAWQHLYDPIFLPAAYGFLALTAYDLARPREAAGSGS